MFAETEITTPSTDEHIHTSADVTYGNSIPHLQRLQIIDQDGWEELTLEFASYWKTQYSRVMKCGGGGDMGRDIIAYKDNNPNEWENYQCKHYNKKLNLAQALLEIGKLVHYSFMDKYSVPVKYYFVTPLGVSTDFLTYLMDSSRLKRALIKRWDKDCRSKITSKYNDNIDLTENFKKHIDAIDFNIFDHIPPIKIIELHARTPYHAIRFGTPIRKRPIPSTPPSKLGEKEIIYTDELLAAFSDAERRSIDVDNLKSIPDYDAEYKSARKNFYSAENLEKFSRDWLPANSYKELVEECYESVSSVVRSSHTNGYIRFLATCTQASITNYQAHTLTPYIKTQDKKGMCHQLVNMKRIRWVER